MSKLFREEAIKRRTRRLDGAVVLASPVSVRQFGILLALILFGALGFVSTASYARKETVVGWVTPDQGLLRTTADQGGRVAALLVQEGDSVAAGGAIARIELPRATADGDTGAVLVASLGAEAEALRQGAEANAARLDNQGRELREHRANLVAQRREAERQVTLQEERIALTQADLARSQTLAERGFFPRAQLETRQAALLAAQQDLSALRQTKLGLDRQIIETTALIDTLPIEANASEANSTVTQAQVEQRRADALARTEYMVRSLVAGRVAALPVRVGQTLAPGSAVAAIVPEGSRLEAELYVPSRAAGFIREGQEVRLLYQAFPHQRFGAGRGEVVAVSRTVLAPNEVAIPGVQVGEPVFRVQVRLTTDYVEAYGQRTPLQAGMLLSADIVIDRRSLLEWLLDPLYAAGRR